MKKAKNTEKNGSARASKSASEKNCGGKCSRKSTEKNCN